MRGVKPLAERPEPMPEPKPILELPATSRAAPLQPLPPHLRLDRLAGIDRATAERLKRGRRRIEARLDLHGMTQDEAHGALLGFIRNSRAVGRRCVLVITGRGSFGGGVLRAAVPRWFEEAEFRPHLLATAPAQPRDGGAGALYVMLRRSNTEPER
jgi:DNA-nicking Smr family endonuclease